MSSDKWAESDFPYGGLVRYHECSHVFRGDRFVVDKICELPGICPKCKSGLKPTKLNYLKTFHICQHLELKWMQGNDVKDFGGCRSYICHLNSCPWDRVCIEKIGKIGDDSE